MIFEKSEREVDVPVDEVWDWVKELKNIVSVIPRVELFEMVNDRKAKVRGYIFPEIIPLTIPEEIGGGIAETVEVDESEKYTRTITENEVFQLETYLECDEMEEGVTEIFMEVKGELKGLSGTILESMVFVSPVMKAVSGTQIDAILEDLGKNLKEYMRNYWKKELENKTEELEAFVYTVSHDLRTPLISVEGFSDMLYEEYEDELGEDGIHYLDRIRSNIQKMDEFIDDLLQLSRVGREEPEKEEIDLGELVKEIVEDLSTRIEEKGIEIDMQEDLPTILFERKRMYQVFSNLISNACKYIGEPENPRIEIGAQEKGSPYLLWVKDNGIGIEPENQDKIFDIFNREERADEKGTGVGLAIIKRIIENHGGEIWVESEKGEGSEFYIKIPE